MMNKNRNRIETESKPRMMLENTKKNGSWKGNQTEKKIREKSLLKSGGKRLVNIYKGGAGVFQVTALRGQRNSERAR